jgi:hypothetical protein
MSSAPKAITNAPFWGYPPSSRTETVNNVPFWGYPPSVSGIAGKATTPTYTGPYFNGGAFAVPPAAITGPKVLGADPYLGTFYYNGTMPYPPFAKAPGAAGSGALGYPPFGASNSNKTSDSPYVAPRPRNQ